MGPFLPRQRLQCERVNLLRELAALASAVVGRGGALKLPTGAQHSAWQWLPLADAAQDPLMHPYVRPYAAWRAGR